MAYAVAAATLYVITIALLPQDGGQDVPTTIVNMARELNNTKGVEFVYRFKKIGVPKVVVVANVSGISALERILGNVQKLGKFDVSCKPAITFEDFASQLGIAEEPTKPVGRTLQRDNLFLLKLTADYYGRSTEEYLAARKRSAEIVLERKQRGESLIEVFKNIGERSESIFVNSNDSVRFDRRQTFQAPLVQDLGSNVQIVSYRVQFLDDYTSDATKNSIY